MNFLLRSLHFWKYFFFKQKAVHEIVKNDT